MKSLTVPDRIIILSILPKMGKIEDLRDIDGIIKKIQFTSGELTKYGITAKDNTYHWNYDEPKDFNLTVDEENIIKTALTDLNTAKKLTTEMISLWDIFGL